MHYVWSMLMSCRNWQQHWSSVIWRQISRKRRMSLMSMMWPVKTSICAFRLILMNSNKNSQFNWVPSSNKAIWIIRAFCSKRKQCMILRRCPSYLRIKCSYKRKIWFRRCRKLVWCLKLMTFWLSVLQSSLKALNWMLNLLVKLRCWAAYLIKALKQRKWWPIAHGTGRFLWRLRRIQHTISFSLRKMSLTTHSSCQEVTFYLVS